MVAKVEGPGKTSLCCVLPFWHLLLTRMERDRMGASEGTLMFWKTNLFLSGIFKVNSDYCCTKQTSEKNLIQKFLKHQSVLWWQIFRVPSVTSPIFFDWFCFPYHNCIFFYRNFISYHITILFIAATNINLDYLNATKFGFKNGDIVRISAHLKPVL